MRNPAGNVSTWYVDSVNGSNGASGLASGGNALKNLDGLSERLDGARFTPSTVTVNCTGTGLGAFTPRMFAVAAGGTILTLVGSKTLSSSCTVSSVVAQDATAGVQQEFYLVKTGGPTLVDGQRLRIITSSAPNNVGAVGVIRGFFGGDVTKPYTSAFSSPLTANTVWPQATDTFAVETLTAEFGAFDPEWHSVGLGGGHIEVTDMVHMTTNGQPGISGSSNFARVTQFGDQVFNRCIFDTSNASITRIDANSYWFRGCEFKAQLYTVPSGVKGSEFYQCTFRAAANLQGSLTSVSSIFEGPVSFAGLAGWSNADDTLMSRQMSGTGFTVASGAIFATNTGKLWTPLTGTRNGLAVGLQVNPYGRVNTNVYSVFASISATNPVVMNSRAIQNYTIDRAGECAINCTDSADGSLHYFRSLTTAPATNPIGGPYVFGTVGGLHGLSTGGVISTVAPVGAAAAGHKQLDGARFRGGPTTTTNTATSTIASVDVAAPGVSVSINNTLFQVSGKLQGIDASNNAVSCRVTRTFKRISGTLTALGSTITADAMQGDAAITGCTADLNATGTTIRLQVTGVAATVITWTGSLTIDSGDFVG